MGENQSIRQDEKLNRFEEQIDKFLDEFISVIYKGHDHVVARKFYRDLFRDLIPKYFALKESGAQR